MTWRVTAQLWRVRTSSCSATGSCTHTQTLYFLLQICLTLYLRLLYFSSEDEDFAASGGEEDDFEEDGGSDVGSWKSGSKPRRVLGAVSKHKANKTLHRGRKRLKRQRRHSSEEEEEEEEESDRDMGKYFTTGNQRT